MQVAGRKKSFAGLKKLFLRRAKFIFRLKINFCSCLWHFSLPAFVVFPPVPVLFRRDRGGVVAYLYMV